MLNRESHSSFLVTLGSTLLLFSILQGRVALWMMNGTEISPSGTYAAFASLLIIILGFLRNSFSIRNVQVNPEGAVLALIVVFISDWLVRPYSLLQGPTIRGELLFFTLVSLLLLSRNLFTKFIPASALLAPLLLAIAFVAYSEGRLLFSDDHSVVFYRLSLLKKNFPFIPFYNPLWNGGIDARDFFATGNLNLFLLFSPLIYFFDLHSIYNLLILLVVFGLVPLSNYIGARLYGLSNRGASAATLLSLATGLFWYRWALKYGSMGFVTSTALIPLNLSLMLIALDKTRDFSFREATLFVVSFSLMLLWAPTGIVFLPALLIAVASLRSLWAKRLVRRSFLSILILNIPWILLFLSVSNVDRFLSLKPKSFVVENEDVSMRDGAQLEATHQVVKGTKRKFTFPGAVKSLREWAHSTNPLLVFLGIPGLFALRRKGGKLLYGTTAGWLLVVGIVIAPLKPQLEFDRMLIILGFVLTIPAGELIEQIFSSGKSFSGYIYPSFVSGMLLAGLCSVGGIIYNRSPEIYYFSDGVPDALSKEITQYGGDGRTVFAGFVLHELSNGHLAPLALSTPHPLVASTPFHNVWWYTELIPRDFQLKGDAGIEEYYDLMNATLIIAHERKWREYFSKRPEKYTFISRVGVFNLFSRVGYSSTYFLEGAGQILAQDTSSVRLRIDTPEAVVKFNYFPFLEASGCSISGSTMDGGITLIKLATCNPGSEITIRGKNGFSRLFH